MCRSVALNSLKIQYNTDAIQCIKLGHYLSKCDNPILAYKQIRDFVKHNYNVLRLHPMKHTIIILIVGNTSIFAINSENLTIGILIKKLFMHSIRYYQRKIVLTVITKTSMYI